MLRKASGGKEPPEELIKYAANDFPYYWLRSLEDIRKSFGLYHILFIKFIFDDCK